MEIHTILPDSTKRSNMFTETWKCRGSPWLIAGGISDELVLEAEVIFLPNINFKPLDWQ